MLEEIGLIKINKNNNQYELFSPILDIYFSSSTRTEDNTVYESLIKSENIIFNLLLKNRGFIVEKETLGKALWGESNHDKYSDWAIDQTIKRLRTKLSKLNPDTKIETKRGRGIILR